MTSLYYQRKPIPEGFEGILHDMIKEILKNQPENIEEFCYNHFDKLLRKTNFEIEDKKTDSAFQEISNLEMNQNKFEGNSNNFGKY